MKLSWRNKDYTFTQRQHKAKQDGEKKADINKSIYAADTESVTLPDRYEPLCYQLSSKEYGETLHYLPIHGNALELFINKFIDLYYENECDNGICFIYFHNLMYDWQQLIKNYPDLLAIARTGRGLANDLLLWHYMEVSVYLKNGGLFTGTAPHFSLQIMEGNTNTLEIKFRDTWSFFPSSLDKITKQMGLTRKKERAENLGKIDYRNLAPDDEERIEFEEYAKIDALATRETAEKIRYLHEVSGMRRIRVSAPGFAISKLYHVIPEGTVLDSGSKNADTMQIIVNAYAGGRTGGIYHGYIKDISVLDIHSSYPASMTMLPSFTDKMQYIHLNAEEMPRETIMEIMSEYHCFLVVSGEEKNAKYPSLIQSKDGQLFPVFGEFEKIATTGVEVYAGIMSGDLVIKKFHEIVILDDDAAEILPFRIFIEGAYHRKENSAKDSPEYISAKLEMNSSYGKLIESHAENYIALDYADIIVPYLPEKETDFCETYYRIYVECLQSGGDFMHELEQMIDETFPELDTLLQNETFKFADLETLSLTKKEYGYNVIPAAAALITGISRARLITAIKASGALYWDTDSVFIKDYDEAKTRAAFAAASEWLPPFIQPVEIGDRLGDLGMEIAHADGYLAGTKRYYLTSTVRNKKPDDNGNWYDIKKALHGIPSAPFAEAEKMIEALAQGANYEYTGRARPLKAKEAKRTEDIGLFVNEVYESKFHLDDRLEWERGEHGWNGKCKKWLEM